MSAASNNILVQQQQTQWRTLLSQQIQMLTPSASMDAQVAEHHRLEFSENLMLLNQLQDQLFLEILKRYDREQHGMVILTIKNDLELIASSCNCIAEAAKSEEARDRLGTYSKLIKMITCCFLLVSYHLKPDMSLTSFNGCILPCIFPSKSEITTEQLNWLDQAKIQIMRVFANLCFNHEANREAILEQHPSIACIVTCLKSDNPQVVLTACGCLLNLSMDNEPVQIEMIETRAIPLLLERISINTSDILTRGTLSDKKKYEISLSAIKVLRSIAESDRSSDHLLEKGASGCGLKTIIDTIGIYHKFILDARVQESDYMASLEVLEALSLILEEMGERAAIQRAIVQEHLMDTLLDFIDTVPKHYQQSSSTLDESEEEDEKDEAADFGEIRMNVSKFVTLVTMNDANMKDLIHYDHVIQGFHKWILLGVTTPEVKGDDHIRVAGALSIGNLARSDETCAILVSKYETHVPLLRLLEYEKKRLEATPTQFPPSEAESALRKKMKLELKSVVQVLHAVVGAFKNLTLAVSNRAILGKTGLIPLASDLMTRDGIKQIQFGCIGIIKNLSSQDQLHNTYRIITGMEPDVNQDFTSSLIHTHVIQYPNPLANLVKLVWNSTSDSDTGVRSEGGRCISHLIRVCHKAEAGGLLKILLDNNVIPLLIQIITGATVTQPTDTHSAHDVAFDAVAIETRVFPIVQNEGIVALILMCIWFPEVALTLVRFEKSILPALFNMIQGPSDYESEISALQSPLAIKENDILQGHQHVYPKEMKVNACLLLETLCRADASFHGIVKQHAEFGSIAALADSPSEPVSTHQASDSPLSLAEAVQRILII